MIIRAWGAFRRGERLIGILSRPFRAFFATESAAGVLLILATITALVLANSPLRDAYTATWQIPLTIGIGEAALTKPLLLWINDGLMAIFFFVVGLEIKRELLAGELSSVRRAILPVAAALGGMIVPALVYVLFNLGSPTIVGWGIPMATDIAFVLGAVALLGRGLPTSIRVFLAALAIADDLGAVLVIGLFFTENLKVIWLLWAGGAVLGLAILNASGQRRQLPYLVLGVSLWFAVLKSGIHPTVAGVTLAMFIPARQRYDWAEFQGSFQRIAADLRTADGKPSDISDRVRQSVLHELDELVEGARTPLQDLEHNLHPWVAFGVLPLFALANAGVALAGFDLQALLSPVSLGIIGGLVVGKPVGIAAFSWLAVRVGIADLPEAASWRHLVGVAALAGIGFTMSLFIAGLAFDAPGLLATAKLGILLASLLAAMVGMGILLPARTKTGI